jgi:hypothetical protein
VKAHGVYKSGPLTPESEGGSGTDADTSSDSHRSFGIDDEPLIHDSEDSAMDVPPSPDQDDFGMDADLLSGSLRSFGMSSSNSPQSQYSFGMDSFTLPEDQGDDVMDAMMDEPITPEVEIQRTDPELRKGHGPLQRNAPPQDSDVRTLTEQGEDFNNALTPTYRS